MLNPRWIDIGRTKLNLRAEESRGTSYRQVNGRGMAGIALKVGTLILLVNAAGAFYQSWTGRTGVMPRAVGGKTAPKARGLRMEEEAGEGAAEWNGAQKFSGLTKTMKTVAPVEKIMDVLPHRYPFSLVDKIVEFEPGKRAVGVKCITLNEPQFTGHFPGRPIMPGVMMIEAMAQLGGFIALQEPVSDGKGLFFFAGIDGVRWKKPVVPGDQLVMEMELVSFNEKFGIAKMKGKAFVDGKVAVDVKEFSFALAKE